MVIDSSNDGVNDVNDNINNNDAGNRIGDIRVLEDASLFFHSNSCEGMKDSYSSYLEVDRFNNINLGSIVKNISSNSIFAVNLNSSENRSVVIKKGNEEFTIHSKNCYNLSKCPVNNQKFPLKLQKKNEATKKRKGKEIEDNTEIELDGDVECNGCKEWFAYPADHANTIPPGDTPWYCHEALWELFPVAICPKYAIRDDNDVSIDSDENDSDEDDSEKDDEVESNVEMNKMIE